MGTATLPRLIVALLSILSLAQHAWYWPQLPDRVATHWGANGQADGWMTRTAATVLLCGFQIGVPVFLLAMTALVGRLPSSMVNIPHREYWLHPDRRDSTLDWMNRCISWLAVLTSLFLIALGHLTFVANRYNEPLQMIIFAVLLIAYLTAVFAVVLGSHFRFRQPPPETTDR